MDCGYNDALSRPPPISGFTKALTENRDVVTEHDTDQPTTNS